MIINYMLLLLYSVGGLTNVTISKDIVQYKSPRYYSPRLRGCYSDFMIYNYTDIIGK